MNGNLVYEREGATQLICRGNEVSEKKIYRVTKLDNVEIRLEELSRCEKKMTCRKV